MSDAWFTSDTHFGHSNIIQYCDRPFENKQEMDRILIDNWNAVVKPQDTIYHLGDFSFYNATKTTEIIKKLNGYKILIRGNHDKNDQYFLRAGIDEFYSSTPANPYMFEEFYLSHYPYWETYDHDDRKHKFSDRILRTKSNRWLLCGHVHDIWKSKERCINVGVDVWEYRPVSIDEIRIYKRELQK